MKNCISFFFAAESPKVNAFQGFSLRLFSYWTKNASTAIHRTQKNGYGVNLIQRSC